MGPDSSSSLATIHPLADVQSPMIGKGTRIWQFCVVLEKARIGSDCNICSHVFIENDVFLGDRVTVKCGVQLWDGVHVYDDVFIGPNATFTNDLRPRSKGSHDDFRKTQLLNGCSIGANATILPIEVGRWAFVAAGSVVTKDVPDFALVKGNPARITGWVCKCRKPLQFVEGNAACPCGSKYELSSTQEVTEL